MSEAVSPVEDIAEVKGDTTELKDDVADIKEDATDVKLDATVVNPVDVITSEDVPEEKYASTMEASEEVEASHNTFEMVQEAPTLDVEDLFQETPSISESIEASGHKEKIAQVSEKPSVSEKSQEQIEDVHSEKTEEQIQPSDLVSSQEAVKEEEKLVDVPISEPHEEKKEEPIALPDTEQDNKKLEEATAQVTESAQVGDEGVTTEKEGQEGTPVEEGLEVMDIEREGRKSMIPGIDELVQPAAPTTPQREETEIEHIASVEAEVSRVSLHEVELPEIRGLAELENLERKESLALSLLQEDWMDDDFLPSRRKSTRPSMALRKLMEDEDEEPIEKGKKRASKSDFSASLGRIVVPFVDEIEEEQPLLTREEYYNLFDKLMSEFPMIKIKNKFLQRKMGELFKKRKVEHALKEEFDVQADVIEKYQNQLIRLSHLLKVYRTVTIKLNNELDNLQKQKDVKDNERQIIFNKLINREKEIGFGLISTKTGKEIPNKVVEQLIRRQLNTTHETSVLRLKYITKRDEFAEKTAELKSLDNIGEDLSLMDYEQLKIENRSLADKLEEKEEELTKLRIKCRNAVQVMAHVREKAAALDADMDVLKEDFEEVNYEYIEMRERLNFCKTERDEIRNKTMKLKAASGLLTKPKLLLDMETSLEEAKLLEETLEKIKSEYNTKTQKIRCLRKNIAYEMMMNRKPQKKKKKAAPKFYNPRPTLVMPKLPTNVIDRLQKIMKDSVKAEKLKKKI
ncbi:hypothetical protein WA026_010956 [Henosepilachna vigintioctopunctata]|uniref:CCDC113/CCDC96 coiled-coil domain-containing protein n=1 Tax=Henosepilachna vigintioctopunctata TaxID=420089 RepID=A0AAW1UPH3_9CUCU